MELISRDEAIMVMEEELQKTAQEDESISKSARLSLLRYLVDKTTVIPTVEERKEGEWINDTRCSGWTCTHCNYHYGNRTDNYCPNCGASMKGE